MQDRRRHPCGSRRAGGRDGACSPCRGRTRLPAVPAFRQVLTRHEGFRANPYTDSVGVLTVGIGFNLERPNAGALLAAQGINIQDVVAGRRPLSKAEAWNLAAADVNAAAADAARIFPNFGSLPAGVQEVLVNMAFNLGGPKLSKFVRLKEAVAAGDFPRAAEYMMQSKWATQVGDRAAELAEQMRRGGAAPSSAPAPASAGGRAASPSPSPPPAAGGTVTVRSGDTLSGIAKRHLGDPNRWREIAQINGIKDPKGIRPGQKLRLP